MALWGACSCSGVPSHQRLLTGGTVHTPQGPRRLEVAVDAGRIVALVDPSRSAAWRRAAGEVVDVTGAHLYPGFTEGHGHLTGFGTALEQVDLVGADSYAEVIRRAADAARELPEGSWVLGRGWDQNLWDVPEFPHHAALSAAVPRHPVLLRRVDGHAALANALALELAGVSRDTEDPAGGRLLRDGRGVPTGVLVDTAMDLLSRHVPPPSSADVERRILRGGEALARLGFTSIHDAGAGREVLAVLRRLQMEERLPLRVYAMVEGSDRALLVNEFAAGPLLGGDGMLAVRAVKLYVDGALGSRGAWLTDPYVDEPGSSGLAITTPEELAEVVERARQAGFQPAVHAIGDRGVAAALDVYERVLGDGGQGLRPRIEHAQIVRPEDVPRFARLGVVAAVQPVHCISDMPWVGARIGEDRAAWAYRWRSLLVAGARLALGSDVPVEPADPFLGMWAARTRRPVAGPPEEGWNPGEALTAAEAVAGYTVWGAYAAFEEGWRGVIRPGWAADFTVVDRDLETGAPADVRQARVVRTVVAGRDAFIAGGKT